MFGNVFFFPKKNLPTKPSQFWGCFLFSYFLPCLVEVACCSLRVMSAFLTKCPLRGACVCVCVNLGGGIFPLNFCIKWLLGNVGVHFDCASLHKVCVRVLGSIWAAAFVLQISVSSGSCEMLACVLTAQARTKCVSAFWAQSGRRHFSYKFVYNAAPVKCCLAFRLRRLAQSVAL